MFGKRGQIRKSSLCNFPKKNRRGQVTIFIIIAIAVVAVGVMVFIFYPQIQTTLGAQEQNPESYIQTCIENEITNSVNKLSVQGGSINPGSYLLYQDNKVEYLCYTNEYYKPCTVQEPALTSHIESEIETDINTKAEDCFNSMVSSYERQGYTVDLKRGDKIVQLLPQRIVTTFNYSMTLTKGTDVQKYDSFIVMMDNNLYELSAIANNIVEWETAYGDAEISTYMTLYHNLKVEKNLVESGTKIYIITDRNTGNKFQFATRGQVWPAGYLK
jgi:hypothetical protein